MNNWGVIMTNPNVYTAPAFRAQSDFMSQRGEASTHKGRKHPAVPTFVADVHERVGGIANDERVQDVGDIIHSLIVIIYQTPLKIGVRNRVVPQGQC